MQCTSSKKPQYLCLLLTHGTCKLGSFHSFDNDFRQHLEAVTPRWVMQPSIAKGFCPFFFQWDNETMYMQHVTCTHGVDVWYICALMIDHYHKYSTSQTHWMYSLFFNSSCFVYAVAMTKEWILHIGVKHLYVKWCVLYILCSWISWHKRVYGHCCQCLPIVWLISCLLLAASVAWWWHCGRLLWQEMIWCLISCCVVWWSLPCGRPWHDILSMLLHNYMSERCLWGSIHISSIVSHRIPLCEGRIHNHPEGE